MSTNGTSVRVPATAHPCRPRQFRSCACSARPGAVAYALQEIEYRWDFHAYFYESQAQAMIDSLLVVDETLKTVRYYPRRSGQIRNHSRVGRSFNGHLIALA